MRGCSKRQGLRTIRYSSLPVNGRQNAVEFRDWKSSGGCNPFGTWRDLLGPLSTQVAQAVLELYPRTILAILSSTFSESMGSVDTIGETCELFAIPDGVTLTHYLPITCRHLHTAISRYTCCRASPPYPLSHNRSISWVSDCRKS